MGAVALATGLWFLRIPIAEGLLRAELAQRGVEADFRLLSLDFQGASLAAVRLGPEEAPDVAVAAVEARWGWRGLTPSLQALRVIEPRLRLRMDQGGRVSAGALEDLTAGGEPSGRRPGLPRIRLDIEDGQALIEAPFGALSIAFQSAGALGRDFSALARMGETTHPGQDYALAGATAELLLISRDDDLSFRLTGEADGVRWAGTQINGIGLGVTGAVPLDLSRAALQASWRAASLRAPGQVGLDRLAGSASAEAAIQEDALIPATWRAEARTRAARLALQDRRIERADLIASASGADAAGRGEWTLNAEHFSGFAMISEQPGAAGQFSFELSGDEHLTAEARVTLARARLSAEAQQDLRDAFPNLQSAPMGPTFARAETALDAAADRFDLAIPLTYSLNETGSRLAISAPIEARAASGTVLRIAPLRDDAAALVLQWPGPSLGGAVAIDLSGGGAPNATLLLDTMTWAQAAPFEAEGTLTINEWSASGARIGAQELAVSLAVPADGGGHLELVGPARITGPLGDGQVRDLVADLDLAVDWGSGWRVTPNQGCLPVRLAGLDVAGLSFAAGAFSFCPAASGALIAADANERLSGGFVIQALRLSGRMAGPKAQPARVGAARVVGNFSGTADDITLQVEAAAPSVAIDIDPERTIAFQGSRLTADTHIANGTWNVVGAFEAGALDDPSLPGAVSAIAGRWSAAPEDDKVVMRVEAGEAFVTARAAPIDAEDQRPLFNPVRLTGVEAELREGDIDAHGGIILDGDGHALATFTAEHNTATGIGAAHVIADNLVFDESLQPYEISELARGLVENVRGPASATADIVWDEEEVRATGTVRPQGLSLAMATIPVIEGVSGEVFFSDLFTLTTPPGQSLTIGALNPGIEVRNGRIRFQLLTEERVAIEQAEFDFAQGILSVDPTEITLGAEETRFRLALRDVDVEALVAQLNLADIRATGRVEGAFPIRLTSRSAFIENGELRAAPGGGTIAYVGNAGADVTGTARVAFDALRSFRYDDLTVGLNGDLSGEVVSSISFSGENTGRPVDLAPIASAPGLGQVNVRGVPFAFNVTVTAPFRQLAQTAAGVIDPGDILGRSLDEREGEAETEDETSGAPSVDVQVEPLR